MLSFAIAALALFQVAEAPPCDLLRSSTERRSGLDALQNKQYAAAAERLRVAFDACPAQRTILLELSMANTYKRDFPQAITAARQFLEMEPGSMEGRLALANAYFMAQRLPDSLREAEMILKADPGHAAALKLKGNIEYLSGRLDDALNAFFTLLEKHPEDEEGAYMLGRIYYQEGRIDYAIGQFQRVLRLNPKSYKAYDNLGLCYESRGETEMAIRHFLTAIKLVEKDHPDYDWPYANLASILVDKGDAKTAFDAAAKAANRNPYSARNFYLGGKALWKLGKTELCLNWLERSAALDPNYPEPLYLLARVYSQVDQPDKAKAALEKFQKLKASGPRQRK
ncbi:MAG: tetratricopeptide repeat protein [Acidobacteriota bacterium]